MPSSTQVCDTVFSILVVILSLVYLCFQGRQLRWNAVLAFIIIFALLWLVQTLGFHSRFLDWRVCLLVALVGSNVVALPQTVYAAQHGQPSQDGDGPYEGFASGGGTTKRSKRERGAAKTGDRKAKKGGYVDTFSTFMETYKGLNPNQIERMTTDTRELIQTQKSLMDTVKSFAPVLKEGREMMSTVKEYFGEGADSALAQAIGGGGGGAGADESK